MLDKKNICYNCKHLYSDWRRYNEDDEYEVFYCACIESKKYKHIIEEPHCHTCINFSERPAPEPYKEEFTKCDKCEMFDGCYKQGILLNVTDFMDSVQHFVLSPFATCAKEVGDVLA